jgi:outer membrane protein TolC
MREFKKIKNGKQHSQLRDAKRELNALEAKVPDLRRHLESVRGTVAAIEAKCTAGEGTFVERRVAAIQLRRARRDIATGEKQLHVYRERIRQLRSASALLFSASANAVRG